MVNDDHLSPSPSWATRDGHVSLSGVQNSADESSSAADRLLLVETIYRYGWAYDERDRDVLSDCFTEDTVFEGIVGGDIPIGPFVGRDTFLDWLTAIWDTQQDQRRHIVLNPLIDDLTATTATVTTIMLLSSASDGKLSIVTAGFYRTTMRKEDGRWRIAKLVGGFDVPY